MEPLDLQAAMSKSQVFAYVFESVPQTGPTIGLHNRSLQSSPIGKKREYNYLVIIYREP